MALRHFQWMLLLFKLAAYVSTSTGIDQCWDCQTPMIQNQRVPWRHSLKNTTNYFSGLGYKSMIRVLPKYSFVAWPSIRVCIDSLYCKPRCMFKICFWFVLFVAYQFWQRHMTLWSLTRPERINSSDVDDGMFRLSWAIPCLLMLWLLTSPEHQQARYWQYRTDNMYCYSRVYSIYSDQVKSKVRLKYDIYPLWPLKQLRMLRVCSKHLGIVTMYITAPS